MNDRAAETERAGQVSSGAPSGERVVQRNGHAAPEAPSQDAAPAQEHVLEYRAAQAEVVAAERRALRFFRRLGPAGPMAVAAAVLPVIGGFALLGSLAYVAPWLRGMGELGIVLYVLGFAVLGGMALLPTYANSIIGGWTFGFLVGFPAAMAGLLGGATVAYMVAGRASGDRVMHLIQEHPKWQAVYDALLRSGFFKTLMIITLLRLPPNSPYAITNLVMAAARVPRLPFLLGTLLGMAPRTGFTVYVAAGLAELDFRAAEQTWMFIAGLVLTLVVIIIIGLIAKHAIERVTRQPEPASAPDEANLI